MRCRFLVLCLLAIGLSSCGRDRADSNSPEAARDADLTQQDLPKDLKTAVSVTFSYDITSSSSAGTPPRETKKLEINSEEELKKLLATISITSTEEGTQAALIPHGRVDFKFSDETVVNTFFVKSRQIDWKNWEQILLSDEFYLRACEIVSKVENRPIDVLKVN